MHPMEQPAQAEATEARGDPKGLRPGYQLVKAGFFRCYNLGASFQDGLIEWQ